MAEKSGMSSRQWWTLVLGVFGAAIGGATAIGPLAGGVLTDTLGWRSIFFINLPIGAAAFAAGAARLRESRDPAGGHADWPGTALITAALTALMFALIAATPSVGPARPSWPCSRPPQWPLPGSWPTSCAPRRPWPTCGCSPGAALPPPRHRRTAGSPGPRLGAPVAVHIGK